ncbi:MAG TPA: RNA polymerase sporulation sigma factor SigH [Lachnospiraceae bacterium]|nr:RNA polymerase sporulation sigma factor SigH [Lachnospiraceae bacterium]
MKEYSNVTDEELIVRIRDGENEITDYIINKYKDLVRKKAQSMYILGADNEDIIQEGMIGLFKAIRDYDAGRDASFFTFADICISRQMYTAIQAAHRQKHFPLNHYISLYSSGEKTPDAPEGAQLINVLASVSDKNPEKLLIDRENIDRLEQIMEKDLSPLEKQVVDLFLTGMGYAEIARVLGRDEKSTDNALQRIKAKIKKGMEL